MDLETKESHEAFFAYSMLGNLKENENHKWKDGRSCYSAAFRKKD